MNRRYGWRPDKPDHRDLKYAMMPRLTAALPPSVDLRPQMPPVVDQGELGACTGNGIAGIIGFLELKDGLVFDPVSRLFIYYGERTIEDTVGQDAGAEIRDGIKVVASVGACSETRWPYDVTQFTTKPPQTAYDDALKHQVTAYARLETPGDFKQCLADGFPFTFGITLYDSFEGADVSATGIVPMPGPGEKPIGGHCMVVGGYDDLAQCYTVRNSWGTDWGAAGYCYIPYAYMHSDDVDDCWTIRREAGF